ncbi:helix-turn-helix domain-containing protein [Gammaproteobacteria bacterium]|nr:helix-turn-helix domain-containing protein [Gammaproteobacteria bacterium]MDB4137238.1 helix-turn-helix domain-containing protein [Gammaproteobacteria bacterium]
MTNDKPIRLLTPKEAADYLSVSSRTLKRLVIEKSIPAVRVRGSMRFRFEDLLSFVEQNNWS